MPKEFVKVARTDEVRPGEKKQVKIGDEYILLVHFGGRYYAMDGVCPHAFALLSYGQMYGEELMCPVHGAVFNIKTGAVLSPPANENLAVYPVRIEGDYILVGPPESKK